MKRAEEIMEVLVAYDLTGSFRDAAELAGCDHHTVARYVRARDAGRPITQSAPRAKRIDPFQSKLEEWVKQSSGRVRADVAYDKLQALGYAGSERSARRAVAEVKAAYQHEHRRQLRPWLPEPGLWLQWDYSDGPLVQGRATWLFCAWLAWSRFRVVLPIVDKPLATVLACLATTFQRIGGVPSYALTDNEKTVTLDHIAGVAVRNPGLVAFGRHYGLTIATCVPCDPQSKGGAEATVRLAQADLVPTEANLLDRYESFAELYAACDAWCETVNGRPHRATRCAPAERLVEEQRRLHVLPSQPFTAVFGTTRRVGRNIPVVQFQGCEYSVPQSYVGQSVWVRNQDDEVVFVHAGARAVQEIARHGRGRPGQPQHDPSHFGPLPAGPLERQPHARTAEEAAFLALGPGAAVWLKKAAAGGTLRLRAKMDLAVGLARLQGAGPVDAALALAAELERFATNDLSLLLSHQATAMPGPLQHATEGQSLQAGTAVWASLGA